MKKTKTTIKTSSIKDRFDKEEWAYLESLDKGTLEYLAATPWQDPDNIIQRSSTVTELIDLFPSQADYKSAKPTDLNWRELQKQSYVRYRTFGPLNASVNSKADYVAEAGFSIYSDIYEINLFLNDLVYSFRNKLYFRAVGWMIRMQSEGEIFVLVALDEAGTATLRICEPDQMGQADDKGLIPDPEDITQTLFYKYYGSGKEELIPDARFILEPDYMKERAKPVIDKTPKEKFTELTTGGSQFKKVGGYRRFILHWKNLTGVLEYLRDTTSLSTVLEWINLYVKSLKWAVDHKRAISAYTWAFEFGDTPTGKVAWHVWNKMTVAERKATGLTEPFSPGSKVFCFPGLALKAYSPQIPSLSGSNQDLLNMAGAGARTPTDLWQGDSAGMPYASVKATRSPLTAEIENLQSKFGKFFRYELLRVCFTAKLAFGGKIISPTGKKVKLPPTYKIQWPTSIVNGTATFEEKDDELCNAVKFTFPTVKLIENPSEDANACFGSKHLGLQNVGVSDETLAKRFGIDDLSRERRKKLIEEQEFGKAITGPQGETQVEQTLENKGADGTKKKSND